MKKETNLTEKAMTNKFKNPKKIKGKRAESREGPHRAQ